MKQQTTQQNKIPNDWQEVEKNGNKFYFPFEGGKLIKIKFIKSPKQAFIADGGPNGIRVDKYFFKLEKNAKKACLWHERYHCHFWVISRKFNLISKDKRQLAKFITWFFKKEYKKFKHYKDNNLIWIEEFNADRYAEINMGIKSTVNFRRYGENIYGKGIKKYDFTTHPPIEERIKRIMDLKNENTK